MEISEKILLIIILFSVIGGLIVLLIYLIGKNTGGGGIVDSLADPNGNTYMLPTLLSNSKIPSIPSWATIKDKYVIKGLKFSLNSPSLLYILVVNPNGILEIHKIDINANIPQWSLSHTLDKITAVKFKDFTIGFENNNDSFIITTIDIIYWGASLDKEIPIKLSNDFVAVSAGFYDSSGPINLLAVKVDDTATDITKKYLAKLLTVNKFVVNDKIIPIDDSATTTIKKDVPFPSYVDIGTSDTPIRTLNPIRYYNKSLFYGSVVFGGDINTPTETFDLHYELADGDTKTPGPINVQQNITSIDGYPTLPSSTSAIVPGFFLAMVYNNSSEYYDIYLYDNAGPNYKPINIENNIKYNMMALSPVYAIFVSPSVIPTN